MDNEWPIFRFLFVIFRVLFNWNSHWVLNNRHKKTAWIRKCCVSSFAKNQRATQFSLETMSSLWLELSNSLVHIPDSRAFLQRIPFLRWKLMGAMKTQVLNHKSAFCHINKYSKRQGKIESREVNTLPSKNLLFQRILVLIWRRDWIVTSHLKTESSSRPTITYCTNGIRYNS